MSGNKDESQEHAAPEGRGLARRLSSWLTERNCLIVLFAVFLVLSIAVALVPYDPSKDLADATTNDIWIDNYAKGVYHIPYSEWNYPQTQSVVVLYEGQYVVVNEKGPGHVMMLLPFHMAGADTLFAPAMVALAVFSTYMLGKRLANWRVGFVGAALVLTNMTVLAMWYRSYWTDASTMHLLVLSIWLLVESNYWFNGRSLDPRDMVGSTTRQKLEGAGLGVLSGLAFGASVSTRYATALVILAMAFFLVIYYLLRAWPFLKKREILQAARETKGLWAVSGAFLLGLMCVLVPLMRYNMNYFGSPFESGYDQTLVFHFSQDQGLTDRNTSEVWSSSFSSMVGSAASNLVTLLPVLVGRMPALVFLPLALWLVRRRPLLWSLVLWLVINLFTYLSISWVSQYARLPTDVLWEPRYFMPSIPPIALLGGVAVDRLAPWLVRVARRRPWASPEARRTVTAAIIIFIVGCLALWGVVPAMAYLANPNQGGGPGPGPGGQPKPMLVTTDQLNKNPQEYVGKLVEVRNATVLNVSKDLLRVRSDSSVDLNGSFALWPPDGAPEVQPGDIINVVGIFAYENIPLVPLGYLIKVGMPPPNSPPP